MHLVFRQLVEHDHFVDAVQELGPEDLLELSHHPALHLAVLETTVAHVLAEAKGLPLRDGARADVRGHDDDAVTEVHSASLGVGEPTVLQDLQQYVEHVGVRFLDLVEEDDAVGLASHRLGELPAFVVSDVAGRRTDQPAHGMLFHVLGHIDLDQGVLVAEEELGQRTGQLRLAHPRGAEEDKGAGRTARIL